MINMALIWEAVAKLGTLFPFDYISRQESGTLGGMAGVLRGRRSFSLVCRPIKEPEPGEAWRGSARRSLDEVWVSTLTSRGFYLQRQNDGKEVVSHSVYLCVHHLLAYTHIVEDKRRPHQDPFPWARQQTWINAANSRYPSDCWPIRCKRAKQHLHHLTALDWIVSQPRASAEVNDSAEHTSHRVTQQQRGAQPVRCAD